MIFNSWKIRRTKPENNTSFMKEKHVREEKERKEKMYAEHDPASPDR